MRKRMFGRRSVRFGFRCNTRFRRDVINFDGNASRRISATGTA